MKVKDFIEKLKQFDPELPVCIADWAEGYANPSEEDAERIQEATGNYYPIIIPQGNKGPYVVGKFVCIG